MLFGKLQMANYIVMTASPEFVKDLLLQFVAFRFGKALFRSRAYSFPLLLKNLELLNSGQFFVRLRRSSRFGSRHGSPRCFWVGCLLMAGRFLGFGDKLNTGKIGPLAIVLHRHSELPAIVL